MENLPVGFRFLPSDAEIIEYFLYKKLRGENLPHDYVKDCDLYEDKEPWKLFDKNAKQNFYVFVKLNKRSGNGSTKKRTAGCGTWDGQCTKQIENDQGRVIGLKKLLIFEVPKAFKSQAKDNGHWIMHEFSIPNNDQYVLCRIRNKDLDKVEPSLKNLKLKARKCSQEELENYPRKRIRNSAADDDTEPKVQNLTISTPIENLEQASMSFMGVPEIEFASSLEPESLNVLLDQYVAADQELGNEGQANEYWSCQEPENMSLMEVLESVDFGVKDYDVSLSQETMQCCNPNQKEESQDLSGQKTTSTESSTRVCLDSETLDQLIRVSNSKDLWEQYTAADNENQANEHWSCQEPEMDSCCNWEYNNYCALDDFYDCMLN